MRRARWRCHYRGQVQNVGPSGTLAHPAGEPPRQVEHPHRLRIQGSGAEPQVPTLGERSRLDERTCVAFRGCFVGVDRYARAEINFLTSAVRDAEALHGLFTDNLGSGGQLICDDQATAANVRAALVELRTSTADDVVVLSFSGHGTMSHQLVTFDADPDDLAGSCISLDELTDHLARIPARQLVCILDCCFAGGAGAKVLTSPLRSRSTSSLASAAAKLDAMSGTGRLILTASAADEEAWEDGRLGHGLLTYALLEALLGAESVRSGDQLPIYKLLHFVVEQVRSGAATHGARQTATLRGQMDGEITWPLFTRGPLYLARFPERSGVRVTASVDSLEPAGFARDLVSTWSAHIPALNQLQQDAINDFGLLAGDHLLVSAPTSSGKTLLGELAALQAVGRRQRSVFLLPTRALVNDKHDQFTTVYGPLGVRVVRATGEIADDVAALMRGQFDIALLTYEMFSGLVLAAPHLLRMLALVVVDEVQTITDASRGANLEFLLTLIRSRREDGVAPQLLLLSAVLGDTGGLDTWLNARHLRRTERPVPLHEGVIRRDGTWRYLSPDGTEQVQRLMSLAGYGGSSRDVIVPLVRQLVGEGKQVLVFRNERGRTRGCARYLAGSLGLPPAAAVIADLPDGDLSRASIELRNVLTGGVAFHNAELDRDEKQAIERHFRTPDTALRVIVATTTLAQGVNTPAEAVIIAELEHPGGRDQPSPYSVAEYKNIIGRAGRLGYAASGQSYVLVEGTVDEDRKWHHYITGVPEDLRSTLLDPRLDELTLIVRVLASAATNVAAAGSTGLTTADVVSFLRLSFGAHQSERAGRERFRAEDVNATLDDLVRAGLVDDTSGQLVLTALGRIASSGAATAHSVLRLAAFFGSVPARDLNRTSIICAAQVTDELEATQMPMNGRGWKKELATYGGVLEQQGAGAALNVLLSGNHVSAARRVKRAVGCLLWMDGVPRAQIDQVLTRHLPSSDGASYAQGAASRTRDVIDIVLDVAQHRHADVDLSSLRASLPVQLELGVPQSLVPVASSAGQRLTRTDYLRLRAANFAEAAAASAATDAELLACVDNSTVKLVVLRDACESITQVGAIGDIVALLEAPSTIG